MTKFDELMELIRHNKNKDKNKLPKSGTFGTKKVSSKHEDDLDIEVTGTDANSAPIMAAADDSTDPDIIDQLYTTKWRNIPNRGEGGSSWDQD